jgi:hypothetical protein
MINFTKKVKIITNVVKNGSLLFTTVKYYCGLNVNKTKQNYNCGSVGRNVTMKETSLIFCCTVAGFS